MNINKDVLKTDLGLLFSCYINTRIGYITSGLLMGLFGALLSFVVREYGGIVSDADPTTNPQMYRFIGQALQLGGGYRISRGFFGTKNVVLLTIGSFFCFFFFVAFQALVLKDKIGGLGI